jgi:glutathione S-transferase
MTWQRIVGNCERPISQATVGAPWDGRQQRVPLLFGFAMRTDMLKFYYARGTCALASHIALQEAGAAYTAERIDFKSNQQNSPEYLAINPKGRVPSLVTDRGVLTETPAMLGFIAQSFPAAKLAPLDDAFAFAQLQAFNSYLCSTVHVAHAHKGRGYRWATDETSFADMKRHGAQKRRRQFRADRAQDVQGAVGDG